MKANLEAMAGIPSETGNEGPNTVDGGMNRRRLMTNGGKQHEFSDVSGRVPL